MFAGSTFKEQRDASRARIEFGEIVQILDNSPAIHLFRIAQEALNNAIKHGHAKTVVHRTGVQRWHYIVARE